jgi:ABC-2 type transport system permease protein
MTETLTGFWVVGYRELLRLVRERSRFLSAFLIPALVLLMVGAGFNRIVSSLESGVSLVQFMFPGVIVMGVLMTSLFTGLGVVWDRELGFLKVILIAPLGRVGIALGKTSGGAVVAVVQGLIMVSVAPVLGLPLTGAAVFKAFVALTALAFTLSSLGILIGSRMRSQQGFHGVAELVLFPLVFFSSIFFPVDRVPVWLAFLAKLNPLTYGVDAVRQAVLQQKTASAFAASVPFGDPGVSLGVTVFGQTLGYWQDVAIVAAFGALLIALSTWSFNKQGG